MKKLITILGLIGLIVTGCNFQESNPDTNRSKQSGDIDEMGGKTAQYVPKFTNRQILESLVQGGFSPDDIEFHGNEIWVQEDISMERELVERQLESALENTASGENGALPKMQNRALSTNPKVSIADVPKLWYSISSDVLNISGMADMIHDAYAEYEDESDFDYEYTTNYAWCQNTPYKCTRWYTSTAISLLQASWPWQTSASSPPFKVFIAPGSTIKVNATAWAGSGNATPEKSLLHEIGHTLGYTHSNVEEGGTQTIPGTGTTTLLSVMCANGKGTLGDCTNYSDLTYRDRVSLKWSGYRAANP